MTVDLNAHGSTIPQSVDCEDDSYIWAKVYVLSSLSAYSLEADVLEL